MSDKTFMGYNPNMSTQRIGQTYRERTNGGIALTPHSQNSNLSLSTHIESKKINDRNVFTYDLGDGNKRIHRSVNWLSTTSGDVLRFGNGISKDDLSFYKRGKYGLVIKINSIEKTTGKNITNNISIPDFLSYKIHLGDLPPFNQIEVDSHILETSAIESAVEAGKQPNWPQPSWLTNVINAEEINGRNVYAYNAGDGHKKINGVIDRKSKIKKHTLEFDKGIKTEDLIFKRRNNDLIITIKDSNSDSLTVSNIFDIIYKPSSTAVVSFQQIKVGKTILPIFTALHAVEDNKQPSWPTNILNSERIYDSKNSIFGRNIFAYDLGDGDKSMSSSVMWTQATSEDVLQFGNGISKDDLSFYKRDKYNLEIKINSIEKTTGKNITNSISILGFLSGGRRTIYEPSFNKIEVDGHTLDAFALKEAMSKNKQLPEWSAAVTNESSLGSTPPIIKTDVSPEINPSVKIEAEDTNQLINIIPILSNKSDCGLQTKDQLTINTIDTVSCYPSAKDIYSL